MMLADASIAHASPVFGGTSGSTRSYTSHQAKPPFACTFSAPLPRLTMTTRSAARSAAVTERASQLAAVKDALVSNDDCWQLIGKAVLRTHDLQVYASWRLASRACLNVWCQHFDDSSPWLSVFPTPLAHAMWSTVHVAGPLAAEPTREPCALVRESDGTLHDTPPKLWQSAASRLIQQYMRARLEQRKLGRSPEQRKYVRSRLVPMASSCTLGLADFRLHVVWDQSGKRVFMGSAQLDECLDLHREHATIATMHEDGVAVVLNNLIDVFAEDVVRLLPEWTVANAGLAGIAETYPENGIVSAMLSRSDGAVACLATGSGVCTDATEDELRFDFERCVLASLDPPAGKVEDVEPEMLCAHGLDFCLDEVCDYGPKHPDWNEEGMREQYDDVRNEQREDMRAMCDEDDEEYDDECSECLEDLIAVVPSRVRMRWSYDGGPAARELEGEELVGALKEEVVGALKEEVVGALMRLAWVPRGE